MSYLSARRSPYPYHLIIEDKQAGWRQGFMLGAPKPGTPQLISSKTQDIGNITPTDYSYSGMSPLGERETPYESLVLGMGESLQEADKDRRYLSANGVDLSVWPWCMGPMITNFTPSARDTVNGITQFFELGGVLYAANGRYILQRVSDSSWTSVADFGAGVFAINVAVFTSNFDGVQRAFVALSSGPARYSSNGTTWTAMATFTGLAFAAVGREFWWADDTNRLRKCDTNADPTNEANYTSLIFRAGDKSSPITALMVTASGTLVIAKTDGLYTLDQSGQDFNLFPFLKLARDPSNGKAWGQFENSLYTSYGYMLGRLQTDLSWEDIGPEKLIANDSPVRGKVTSFVGVGEMFAYAGVFNTDTQTSYLCKFGAWAPPAIAAGNSYSTNALAGESVHIDAWHGSVSVPFPSQIIQSLFVSAIGAPAAHTRTYIGFNDGTLAWTVNSCVPYPPACSQYRFVFGDMWVQLPTWHAGFHASIKSIRHFAVTGPKLSVGDYVTIDYKTDPQASSWTAFPIHFDSSVYELAPIEPMPTAVLAQFRVHLHNASNADSPLVSAVAIGHALRPQRIMQFEGDILVADGLVRRDGTMMRVGRRKLQQCVELAVDNPGAVTVTLPDESVQELSFVDLKVSQSFDEVGRQYRSSLHVVAIQHFTQEIEL
jgi:hypothetical protein